MCPPSSMTRTLPPPPLSQGRPRPTFRPADATSELHRQEMGSWVATVCVSGCWERYGEGHFGAFGGTVHFLVAKTIVDTLLQMRNSTITYVNLTNPKTMKLRRVLKLKIDTRASKCNVAHGAYTHIESKWGFGGRSQIQSYKYWRHETTIELLVPTTPKQPTTTTNGLSILLQTRGPPSQERIWPGYRVMILVQEVGVHRAILRACEVEPVLPHGTFPPGDDAARPHTPDGHV